MHILLLTTSFPLRPTSASGIFVERLASELGQQCQLHVLAPASTTPPALPKNKTYQLTTFSYAPQELQILAQTNGGIPAALVTKPWLWLLIPLFITSMLFSCLWHARRTNLIFANWSICGAIAGIVGRIWSRPVITTLRGEDANRIESSLFHRLLIWLCLNLGNSVVTVSSDIATRIKHIFPTMAHKIRMIPNGVYLVQDYNNQHSDKHEDKVQLIILGSLIPRKSVQTALSALACLPTDYLLTIIGDGPEMNSLRMLANSLGIVERVHFVGSVPPEQVSTWLKNADVFIASSLSEGRPNAMLEAMATGLPIIATNIPGHRELVTTNVNGNFFAINDVDGLVISLLSLHDKNLRQRYGEASRHYIVEQGLTWENSARLYMNLFTQLTSENKH